MHMKITSFLFWTLSYNPLVLKFFERVFSPFLFFFPILFNGADSNGLFVCLCVCNNTDTNYIAFFSCVLLMKTAVYVYVCHFIYITELYQ